MNILSLTFCYFFLLFFLLYWLLTAWPRLQNGLLLITSYAFIACFSVSSAAILLTYSLLIYIISIFIHKTNYYRVGYMLLIMLILAFFITFKYYPATRENLQVSFYQANINIDLPLIDIIVPLGLSFYIFHSVSYIVSIAKKELLPAGLVNVLLYISFFPSVVCGPINRASHFLPQIERETPRKLNSIRRPLCLLALAIAKLFLCGAWLAERYVNAVFDSPENATPLQLLVAIYAYAWQIYFNFSGYTNLVTALAALLGLTLPVNFNAPYCAQNLQVFWARWHISLSLFIRDYIYIPLGGNRRGFLRKNINLLIAMILSGLWHGAGFNFVLWGAIHGLGLAGLNYKNHLYPARRRGPLITLASRLLTFHFICFAWIFFRATDFSTACAILTGLNHLSFSSLASAPETSALSVFLIFFIVYPQFNTLRIKLGALACRIPWFWFPVPLALFLTTVFFFSPAGLPGFIYANF